MVHQQKSILSLPLTHSAPVVWQLQSSKGKVKSSKGTNHSDDAPSGPSCDEKCTKYTYYTDAHEVDASFYENTIGFGLAEVPVYDDDARLNQVGTFSSAATIAGAGAGSVQEGVRECIISGALSFDLDEYSGLYGSTINFAYTCNSEYNAVVGGTGAYGCASGYQDFTEISEDGTVTEFDVYICGCLCGTDEKPKIEPLEEIINYPSLYPTLYPTGEPVH